MDMDRLIEQVKLNCNISDAGFWGYYTICGMLMRLRDLYRSEHDLMPWDCLPRDDISEWIESREALWAELEDEPLHMLEVDGRVYDPFDAEGVNLLVNRHGLVYGGGYGRFNKPTFFLSRLRRKRDVGGFRVYYAGEELCRDLSSSAAMYRGRSIFIRLEPVRSLLWERLLDLRTGRSGGFLAEALSCCGIEAVGASPAGIRDGMDALSDATAELLLMHELGEAFEDGGDGRWLDILGRNRDRWSEFYLRGIKDVVADTSEKGPLKAIVEGRDRLLLGLYMLLLDGIRKDLFPEIVRAFRCFAADGDWAVVEEARRDGYRRARRLVTGVLDIWDGEGDLEAVRDFIRKEVCPGRCDRAAGDMGE